LLGDVFDIVLPVQNPCDQTKDPLLMLADELLERALITLLSALYKSTFLLPLLATGHLEGHGRSSGCHILWDVWHLDLVTSQFPKNQRISLNWLLLACRLKSSM